MRFSEELRLKDEKEDQASFKSEEETRLAEELRLKAEAEVYATRGWRDETDR